MKDVCSPSDLETIKLVVQGIGYLMGWFLIVAGWIVTSRQSKKRERRQELRSQLDILTTFIEEIEQNALEFYRTDRQNPAGSTKATGLWIVSSLGRLSRVLSRLKKTYGVNVVTMTVTMRQSITGGDFSSINRLALTDKDKKLHDISNSALELIENLEAEYIRLDL